MLRTLNYQRFILLGSIVALVGYILSGPVAFIIVNLIKPQPVWVSPSVFVENYATIQDLPFYFGFLLIGGMLMLATGHYLNTSEKDEGKKFLLLVSLGWTLVFCTLISFNYICQTTFVHNLALNYKPEYDAAIAMFSMSNPLSFCWANEMWGYALLGIATWLMAAYYKDKNNFIRWLLISNGVVSLLSAIGAAVDVNWLMTGFGLSAYFVWNVLMIVMMIAIYRFTNKRILTT